MENVNNLRPEVAGVPIASIDALVEAIDRDEDRAHLVLGYQPPERPRAGHGRPVPIN